MRRSIGILTTLSAALLLSGCVTAPMGPSIGAMPPQGKSFDRFQREQYACEDYASDRVAGGAERANQRAVGTAVIATALGAAIGAATGGGRSTATGAAIGGTVGTVAGANQSARAQYGLQRRYDMAYAECMEAKGNEVGGSGPRHRRYGPPPPPQGYPPPPPPGY